ncbi:MAG TPA: creatininase family protein [Longimicrobiales bacterium]|nr:creatininase family protein [Longimicrobiales bacterium]
MNAARALSLAVALGMTLAATSPAAAQALPQPGSPDPETPRVLPLHDSVWLEELTWLEVRDLLRAGHRTVLIPTGGIEQNGPYLALGKHSIILRATMEALAREMGDALVAPIISFVPEGDIEPPSSHMRYPGTVSVTQETFRALLTDIARSMKAHGFEHVILVGDSGGNQAGMAAVAAALSEEWKGSGTDILHVPEYYDNPRWNAWIADQGIHEELEGLHDDVRHSSLMMLVDTAYVRTGPRIQAGLFRINGVALAPVERTLELARRLAAYQAEVTAAAIRARLGGGR